MITIKVPFYLLEEVFGAVKILLNPLKNYCVQLCSLLYANNVMYNMSTIRQKEQKELQ